MLLSLKQALQRNRDPAPGNLTSRKKIVSILRQLQTDHELLCVRVSGCDEKANSAILGVKENQNYLLLDELSIPAAHKALQHSRKAFIECRLRGMELRFACRLLKADTSSSIALYAVSIPERIACTQRRGAYRLRLNSGPVVPVSIPNFEGQTVSGEVFDLSVSGLGAFLNTRSLPNRGQLLSGVTLSLPHSRPLSLNMEVRFARLDSAHRMLRIGARFVRLDSKQQRLLSQFLAQQQRKRRRHDGF